MGISKFPIRSFHLTITEMSGSAFQIFVICRPFLCQEERKEQSDESKTKGDEKGDFDAFINFLIGQNRLYIPETHHGNEHGREDGGADCPDRVMHRRAMGNHVMRQ